MSEATERDEHRPHVTEAAVKFVARGLFTAVGVDRWYDMPNHLLNNATPRQFVDAGDGDRVLAVLTEMGFA